MTASPANLHSMMKLNMILRMVSLLVAADQAEGQEARRKKRDLFHPGGL